MVFRCQGWSDNQDGWEGFFGVGDDPRDGRGRPSGGDEARDEETRRCGEGELEMLEERNVFLFLDDGERVMNHGSFGVELRCCMIL